VKRVPLPPPTFTPGRERAARANASAARLNNVPMPTRCCQCQKAQGGGALRRGAATGVKVIPLPAVLAEVAEVFPCRKPADHGRRREQLKIGMAAQDGCSIYYLLYCIIVCIGQNITLMTYS
jgi:hypothetical protein